MKGVALLCVILCAQVLAAAADESSKSLGLKMIQAAQSAAKSFMSNKAPIKSVLDFFKKDEIDDKPKPNVVLSSAEGKLEFTIDLSHKEVSTSVDGRYAMPSFRSAMDSIKNQLVPIAQMELELHAEHANRTDVDARENAVELNHKIAKFAAELYHAQDAIKRDLVVLETNLGQLKDSSFRVCDFYFNGYYRDLENRIYKLNEPGLAAARKNYLLQRSKLLWNVADAVKFVAMMSSNFEGLFSFHKKMLFYYNTARNRRDALNTLDESVLDDLNSIFALRVHIAENLDFILREIDAFKEYKDEFQHIFDNAEHVEVEEPVEVQQVQAPVEDDFNAEQYFREKEQKAKNDTMQIAIEESLAKGDITMDEITDVDMADKIISSPLLNSLSLTSAPDSRQSGFGII